MVVNAVLLPDEHLQKMFGYTESELLGQPMELLLPPGVRKSHVAKRIKFLEGGESRRPMNDIVDGLSGCRKDGTIFPVDVSLSRLPDLDGRAGAVCAAIRDITERKRMEEMLVIREQESRTLIENTPDTIRSLTAIAAYLRQSALRGREEWNYGQQAFGVPRGAFS
jgi:PAS domain S-box-containing protein